MASLRYLLVHHLAAAQAMPFLDWQARRVSEAERQLHHDHEAESLLHHGHEAESRLHHDHEAEDQPDQPPELSDPQQPVFGAALALRYRVAVLLDLPEVAAEEQGHQQLPRV